MGRIVFFYHLQERTVRARLARVQTRHHSWPAGIWCFGTLHLGRKEELQLISPHALDQRCIETCFFLQHRPAIIFISLVGHDITTSLDLTILTIRVVIDVIPPVAGPRLHPTPAMALGMIRWDLSHISSRSCLRRTGHSAK